MGYTPPWLNVTKGTGITTIDLGGVTTEDLVIKANPVDTYTKIILEGGSGVYVYLNAGGIFKIYDAATYMFYIYHAGTDVEMCSALADHDFYLKPSGTGVMKFGTHTGSGDVACNGSIAIKDSAGNARKLMTTA